MSVLKIKKSDGTWERIGGNAPSGGSGGGESNILKVTIAIEGGDSNNNTIYGVSSHSATEIINAINQGKVVICQADNHTLDFYNYYTNDDNTNTVCYLGRNVVSPSLEILCSFSIYDDKTFTGSMFEIPIGTDFIINMLWNDGTETFEIDRTFEDIQSAYNTGKLIFLQTDLCIIPLCEGGGDGFYFEINYTSNYGTYHYEYFIQNDGTIRYKDDEFNNALIIYDNNGKSTISYSNIINNNLVRVFRDSNNTEYYYTYWDQSNDEIWFTSPSVISNGMLFSYKVIIDSNNNIEYVDNSTYIIPKYSEADSGKVLKATPDGLIWSFNNDANAFSASGVKF